MTWKRGQRNCIDTEVRLHLEYLAQLNILSTIEAKLYHTEIIHRSHATMY